MDERILKWLYDIKIAIEEIKNFFLLTENNFYKYRENLMLKRAVERDLEIIGEALNRIIKNNETYLLKITHAKSIIGLRKLVIHSYDSVSDENIWSIVKNYIPNLKLEVNSLISNEYL